MESKSSSRYIDKNSIIPYYHQLKEQLKMYFEENNLNEGEQIPSEAELCRTYGVSRTVVRQAITDLVNEGLLFRQKGKGTFIARQKIIGSLMQNLNGFYKDMMVKEFKTRSEILDFSIVDAPKKIAYRLQREAGEKLFKIDRLRFVNDEPIVYVISYIPYSLCPELINEDLANQSLYAVMEEKFNLKIASSRRSIEAVGATEEIATLMDIEHCAPIFLLKSISYLDNGMPVEYYEAKHRGDRIGFEVELINQKNSNHHDSADLSFQVMNLSDRKQV